LENLFKKSNTLEQKLNLRTIIQKYRNYKNEHKKFNNFYRKLVADETFNQKYRFNIDYIRKRYKNEEEKKKTTPTVVKRT
jgi:hypothetical protein